MDTLIKEWIVEIVQQHKQLIGIALRQRAKFEGWLKFELATLIEKKGASNVRLEAPINPDRNYSRSDISFHFDNIRYDLELKTSNTNWRMAGIENRGRPITKNIKSIIRDGKKLKNCFGVGIIAFILFPIPLNDEKWLIYLDRISSELQLSLHKEIHCKRLSVPIGNVHQSDLLVCVFQLP